MRLPPLTTTYLRRYADMIFAVKALVEFKNLDENDGISAILFEVAIGLEKMEKELRGLEIEDFKKSL